MALHPRAHAVARDRRADALIPDRAKNRRAVVMPWDRHRPDYATQPLKGVRCFGYGLVDVFLALVAGKPLLKQTQPQPVNIAAQRLGVSLRAEAVACLPNIQPVRPRDHLEQQRYLLDAARHRPQMVQVGIESKTARIWHPTLTPPQTLP